MSIDINKPAAEINDPMELYARIGFRRACAITRGDPNGYEGGEDKPLVLKGRAYEFTR